MTHPRPSCANVYSFPLGPLLFGLHSRLELFPASFTLATGQHEVIDVEQRQHLQLWSPRRSLDKFRHARIGLALLQSDLFHSFVRRFDRLFRCHQQALTTFAQACWCSSCDSQRIYMLVHWHHISVCLLLFSLQEGSRHVNLLELETEVR